MTKGQTMKSLSMWLVIGVLGVFAVGSLMAMAYSGSANVVVEGDYIAAEGPSLMESLGASGTRFPNGISADTTSPAEGEVRGTTLTITGASTFSGALTVSGALVAPTTTVELLTTGGPVNSTSTASTASTLARDDLISYSLSLVTPTVASLTYTFPASSTIGTAWLPNAGDRTSLVFRNTSSTADAVVNLTFAEGTGIDFDTTSSTLTIGELDNAEFDCFRLPDTDIACMVSTYQEL